MNDSSGANGNEDTPSDWPTEPEEDPLPGEDNPGERLIEKYDPTIDASNQEKELPPETDDTDIAPETARLFWYLVGVFNVALLGVAIGAMLIVFRGRWTLGGQITLGGAILLAYGYYRFRKYSHPDDEPGESTASENDDQNG